MTREQYQSLHLKDLRDIAKSRGAKRTSTMRKGELIDLMLRLDQEGQSEGASSAEAEEVKTGSRQNRRSPATADNVTANDVHSKAGDNLSGAVEAQSSASDTNSAITGERQNSYQDESCRGRRGNSNESYGRGPVKRNGEASARGYHGQADHRQYGTGRQQGYAGRRSSSTGENYRSTDRRPFSNGAHGRTADRREPYIKDHHGYTERHDTSQSEGHSYWGHQIFQNEDHHHMEGSHDLPEMTSREEARSDYSSKPTHSDVGFNQSLNPMDREPIETGEQQGTGHEDHFYEEPASSEENGDRTENPASSIQHPRLPGDTGIQVRGILEVMPDGFGFLRSDNFLPGEEDVYVSPSQIRRFNLKTGDMIAGNKRSRAQGEKYGALLYVSSVNDLPPDRARRRDSFEKMTPVFPNKRIELERADGSRATRIVDLISPIGYGQRGMIVSPPKAGKTTLLKDIAKSILTGNPDANLIILLIDERPEEVTDMKETVHGKNVEIIYSTFDELPEHHRRVAEMVMERAKRLVEHHEDVIILLDSITRLTRAYNILVPQSGRTLSGGLDPAALYMPKKFFGAARNMREGGSLTILATALVDTGSKMDDVVYEEFKGTGNMELILDRKLQERRIFPAIDIAKSGTRREDLLLTPKELRAVNLMRRKMNGLKSEDAVDAIINAFSTFPTNETVVNAVLSKWK